MISEPDDRPAGPFSANGARVDAAQALHRAIIRTMVYADVFDYPLTAAEIHRYLVGVRASPAEVQNGLRELWAAGRLLYEDETYALPGRGSIIETRRRRAAVASQMWPRALRYGRWLGQLPFTRMVAVTGALAVDNVEPGADIDYLLVTEPGRLWLCRALSLVLVRWAARRGDIICPNYLLSTRALVFMERTLYTAHELTQMTPVAGSAVYRQMRELNRWSAEFLPNAEGRPRPSLPLYDDRHPFLAAAEAALRTPLGTPLERWEMGRKVRRLSQQGQGNGEAAFAADWCKGHFDQHGLHTERAYAERLRQIEPPTP